MSCVFKYTSFIVFLAQRNPVNHNLMHSSHRLITWTWSSYRLSISPKKLCNSRGKPSFPPKISQSYLAACWALELHNSANQSSQIKLRTFPNEAAHHKICPNMGSSQLLCPKIMKILWEVGLDPSWKCIFSPSSRAVSCMCSWVD